MTIDPAAPPLNHLFYGDNLEVLRRAIATESVDLIYLDPPFNSNRDYNVIFGRRQGQDVSAQIEAFTDTWEWTAETERLFDECVDSSNSLPLPVIKILTGFRTFLGENDASAYLVNMAPRLVELHRVLKNTGTLYLHCDPTMSHYLKVLLDAIFEPENFRNEIVWKRHNARSVKLSVWPRLHDTILMYTKTDSRTFASLTLPTPSKSDPHDLVSGADGLKYRTMDLTGPGMSGGETGKSWRGVDPSLLGRHWRISHDALEALDKDGLIHWQKSGMPREIAKSPYVPDERTAIIGDIWTDIDSINSGAAERLGYPTQKPLSLLERIVEASSNTGDIVLDPFAGCGTAIDAAQKLGRRWIGIDITYIAIDLIEKRLRHTYGPAIKDTYETDGIPRDWQSAEALFRRSPFDFERWAVSLLDAKPHDRAKQSRDRGMDGEALFDYSESAGVRRHGRIIVSVKGGQQLNPAMVRDLVGTIHSERAELGVLITLHDPTRGMLEAANTSGYWERPDNHQSFPKVQIVTVADLLAGRLPRLPDRTLPYVQAKRSTRSKQAPLF